jgi:hypothetical protein
VIGGDDWAAGAAFADLLAHDFAVADEFANEVVKLMHGQG